VRFDILSIWSTLAAFHAVTPMPRGKIPRPTVKRLSLYLRQLEALAASDRPTISSRQLGDELGLTDAQVRKDLAYFGQFGHPGIGYQVGELIGELRRILGTDRCWRCALVGAGNIGRALLAYGRLPSKGFEIKAVFDEDDAVVGTALADHTVRAMDELQAVVAAEAIEIGLVAVPAAAAQAVAEKLIAAGVAGLLNFAPVRLQVTEDVAIVSVDLTVSLEQLAFKISLGATGADERPGA
jgi:redox-sensing transcriptional repressor